MEGHYLEREGRMVHTNILLLAAYTGIAVGQALPAFEVASVRMEKDADPNHVNSHWSGRPGKLTATGISLRDIVQSAYGVKTYQIKGSDSLTSERYDIQAEWPADTPKEEFPLMLQSLLIERFKFTHHREPKILPVFALRRAKAGPKFQPAAEDAHNSLDGNNGHWKAQHVSMANLAEMLSNQTSRPVVDKTGLSGFFNFEFQFTSGNKRADPDSNDTGPSIFTAVEEQLGLKLVPEKDTVDILIVDHVEKVPTEN